MKPKAYIWPTDEGRVIASPYFEAMFTTGRLSESEKSNWVPLVDARVVQALIDELNAYGFPDGTESGDRIADLIAEIESA